MDLESLTTLEQPRNNPGTIPEQSRNNHGTILEQSWNNPGTILEQSWNNPGTIQQQYFRHPPTSSHNPKKQTTKAVQMACARPSCDWGFSRLKCVRCKYTRYCSKNCQAMDWKSHKILCHETPILPQTTPRRSKRIHNIQPEPTVFYMRKDLMAHNRALANGTVHCMLCGDDQNLRRLRKVGIQCMRCLAGGMRRGMTATLGTLGLVGVAGVAGGPLDPDTDMDLDTRLFVLTMDHGERLKHREIGDIPEDHLQGICL